MLKPVKLIIKCILAPIELIIGSCIRSEGGKCTDDSEGHRDYISSASKGILQRTRVSQAVVCEMVGYLQCRRNCIEATAPRDRMDNSNYCTLALSEKKGTAGQPLAVNKKAGWDLRMAALEPVGRYTGWLESTVTVAAWEQPNVLKYVLEITSKIDAPGYLALRDTCFNEISMYCRMETKE